MVMRAGQVCSHLYQLLEALWCSLYDHTCMLRLQLLVLVVLLLNALLSANNQA